MRAKPVLILALIALSWVVGACLSLDMSGAPRHGWWAGLGPVLPHDSFPADCRLCHVAENWHTLQPDFAYDHEAETGYPLDGAHDDARCLRCHNDRGPVQAFANQGCVGCHEDPHLASLGPSCTDCHRQESWQPFGQIERHNRTRFPLVGVHAATSCFRCHEGAEVGVFLPEDVRCVGCHGTDLAFAKNPDHQALGWVDDCQRCHVPTFWQAAQIDN